MRNLVWIASYPKSGNTWARFMACNLLFGRQESAATVNGLIPDVHELNDLGDPSPGSLFKTHAAFGPNFPFGDRTAAVIYIVRHPADVLASNFFYARRSAADRSDAAAAFAHYAEQFIDHGGDPRWSQLGMGTWEENVRSWLSPARDFPVLRLRYEDMEADAPSACRAIAVFLRQARNDADIEQAVRDSSFERMREIERSDIREKRVGIFYKPYLQASIDSGSRFMRRGVAGDGSARLKPEQLARLRLRFKVLLRELSYPEA